MIGNGENSSNPSTLLSRYLEMRRKEIIPRKQGIIVCFAGVPSAGKSFLSRAIALKHGLQLVATDEMTELVDPKYGMDRQLRRDQILRQFIPFLTDLPTGSCFVFDKGNDRDIDFYARMKSAFNGRLFLIAIDVPREVAAVRIMVRNRELEVPYIADINQLAAQYHEFTSRFSGDISLRIDGTSPLESNLSTVSNYLEPLLL